MLAPKKTKFRKWQTGRKHPDRLRMPDTRGVSVAFGSFGLKAMTPARITSNQIEAARRILFELDGAPEPMAREALRKAGTKLPMKVRVVAR